MTVHSGALQFASVYSFATGSVPSPQTSQKEANIKQKLTEQAAKEGSQIAFSGDYYYDLLNPMLGGVCSLIVYTGAEMDEFRRIEPALNEAWRNRTGEPISKETLLGQFLTRYMAPLSKIKRFYLSEVEKALDENRFNATEGRID
jgi:hypothetical protein